jgi:hypothetical protein
MSDFDIHSCRKVMNMHPMSDLAVFVRTADLGSFAAVGAELELTASGVSRVVSRLERRLGPGFCIGPRGGWC